MEQAAQSDGLKGQTLFPILPPGPTGVARLAEQAPHADDGHLVEFRAMQVRSILNKTVSKRFEIGRAHV